MVSMVEMYVTSAAFSGIERYPSLRQSDGKQRRARDGRKHQAVVR
jgi:hypothetical protein